MSLPHFFLDNQVIASHTEERFELRLSADDAKHAKVLRLGAGEHVAVIDAAQDYFEVEIVSFDGRLPEVRVSRHLDAPARIPRVLLFQGLAKGDKMETVIRHATELGVAGFVPLACKRSIMKVDRKKVSSKAARWQAIAKSAAMQSGQLAIPEVSEPLNVSQACALLADLDAVLVCWEEADATARLAEALERSLAGRSAASRAEASIGLVVGPEGGLDESEVESLLACSENVHLVTLGPSILRTETAGIVASALVLYELGGLGRAPLGCVEQGAAVRSEETAASGILRDGEGCR